MWISAWNTGPIGPGWPSHLHSLIMCSMSGVLKKRSLVVYHFSHYSMRHISWQKWVKQFASLKCGFSSGWLWRHLEDRDRMTETGWGKAQTVVVLIPSETRGSQHLITIRWMQLKGQSEPFLATIPTRRLQGLMSVCLLVNSEISQQHEGLGGFLSYILHYQQKILQKLKNTFPLI